MLSTSGTWRGFLILPILFTWLGFCSGWAVGGLLNPATLVMLALTGIFYISSNPPEWTFVILILYTWSHWINFHTIQPMERSNKELAGQIQSLSSAD